MPSPTVHLVRHGETAWSRTRRHTGSTDVDLTDIGRRQATELAPILAAIDPVLVLTSPRLRATETCRLAGLGSIARTDERLTEWDYGTAEGRTTEELRVDVPGWSVWTHPIVDGEQLADVAARVDSVIADLRAVDGAVVLFGHAHLFRILAARWCGLSAVTGRHLLLEPASVSVLGYERENPAIASWNRFV